MSNITCLMTPGRRPFATLAEAQREATNRNNRQARGQWRGEWRGAQSAFTCGCCGQFFCTTAIQDPRITERMQAEGRRRRAQFNNGR